MVDSQYGNKGIELGKCPMRKESSTLNDDTKSLVLVNHFKIVLVMLTTCEDNSNELIEMLKTCYATVDNHWANFIVVDFYKVA
ncbi:hypothetical protein RDABS01_035763 [Bienertia sinuspersici]